MTYKVKQIVGLFLSIILVFSLATPSFADEFPTSPTVNNEYFASTDENFT